MLLRARLILPISSPPIENGALALDGNHITHVGRWNDLQPHSNETPTDLGDVILLPGLINAHCHLDYTDMAGHLSPPKSFTDWIKSIVAFKASWSYTEFANSWINGAQMLLQSGTTTVADVESVPELIPDLWNTTPLRVHSFRELIQLQDGDPARQTVNDAASEWADISHPRCRTGLSPHAPYTTTSDLLRAATAASRQHQWQLTTHVAESEEEFDMFMHGRGPLFDWLKSQRLPTDCSLGSPISHLQRSGYLHENLLAVHANYLHDSDATTLAENKVSVVHCPLSHAYFNHKPFPYHELASAGVNICLGTDSLASTRRIGRTQPQLNLFHEMQSLASSLPSLPPETILKMATINAAHALGYKHHLGQLQPGALADLITIPSSAPISQAFESTLHNPSPVSASMINGQWTRPAIGNQ